MRDWSEQTERLPEHPAFEQNAFNIVIQRRGKALALPTVRWNLHGHRLTDGKVSRHDGAAGPIAVDGEPVLILHPTSPRAQDIAIRPFVRVGRERIPCQYRLAVNPILQDLQVAELKGFLLETWDELCDATGIFDSERVAGLPLQPVAGVSPMVGFLLQDAFDLHRRGEWIKAEDRITGIEKIAPNHPLALCNRSITALRRGRAAEALDYAEKVLQSDPQDARAHARAGSALIRLGRWPDAVASLGHAIAAVPGLAETHVELARAHAGAGNFAAAAAAATQAIALAPDLFGGWFWRARALDSLGRPGDAKADREEAMALIVIR
jgi:hypothetical protein